MKLPQHLSCLLLAGIALCGIGGTISPAMADVLDNLGTDARGLEIGGIPVFACENGVATGFQSSGSPLELDVCPVTVSAPTQPTPGTPTISGGSNSAALRGVAGSGPVARSTPARPTKNCKSNAGC